MGATMTAVHDTVAPALSVSPGSGFYTGPQDVAVTSDAPVTYELDGAAARSYTRPIRLLPGNHTLVLRSEDAAGNVTTETLGYDIVAVPASGPGPGSQAPGPQAATGGGSPAAGGGSTPTAATPRVLPAVTRAAAPVASMRGTTRVKLATARRSGLTARFGAPSGTRRAVVTAYRMAGGKRRRVGSVTVSARSGANAVKLGSAAVRRRLARGTYTLEVVLRGADGTSGKPVSATVRVR